jgi:NitT/TauT family transport system permease protein
MPRLLLKGALQNTAVLLCIFALWQLAVGVFRVPAAYTPAPSVIAEAIWFQPGAFAAAVEMTLLEATIGILAGTLVGIVSGVIFSRVPLLERMFFPYFVASQAVPIIAFGAIVIIWFGNGLASKAFIAFYLTFFPVAVNTLRGLRAVSPQQIGLLRTFGASQLAIFLKLQFPSALPSIFTAIRLGASLGLVGAIVGEWFGAQVGLGVVLLLSMFNYQMPELWAAIVLTGVSGGLLYLAVALIESRLVWWEEEL